MSTHTDLLGPPSPTLLPEDPAPRAALADGADPAIVAAAYPSAPLVWAVLAEGALARGANVEAYAYARTGYHRGLDALRHSGWKGHGPIPWSHEPNQGFLRALFTLRQAANLIGETDEGDRCEAFLDDADPAARRFLESS